MPWNQITRDSGLSFTVVERPHTPGKPEPASGAGFNTDGHTRSDMDDDCPFCGIVNGDIPSRTVYENEDVQAFLDANPLTRWHTLVIPERHHTRVADLPTEDRNAVFRTLGRLSPAVEAAVDADGVTVGMNDGAAAGQEVPHVHGHLVPRFDGDGGGAIHSVVRTLPDLSDGEIDELEADIRDAAE